MAEKYRILSDAMREETWDSWRADTLSGSIRSMAFNKLCNLPQPDLVQTPETPSGADTDEASATDPRGGG